MSIRGLIDHSGAFIKVHPHSDLGDLNFAYRVGYDFVSFIPNGGDGLYLLRRAPWIIRVIRSMDRRKHYPLRPIERQECSKPRRERRMGTGFSDIGYGGKGHE